MDLAAVAGRSYGPFTVGCSAEKVSEFVTATGDDRARWRDVAPPGYAAALLFAAAPAFLDDPDVRDYTRVLVHRDQAFEFESAVPSGAEVSVLGTVSSVRERGGAWFVGFEVEAPGYLVSQSTFLMSAGAPIAAAPEEPEPPWDARGDNDVPTESPLPPDELTPLRKSASRVDLIRYAGATRDWNAIHWDHTAAVAAGLPGIVAHGLLVGSWAAQAAGRYVPGDRPLRSLRLRFKAPLRPGVSALVGGRVKESEAGETRISLRVDAEDATLVTGDAVLWGK